MARHHQARPFGGEQRTAKRVQVLERPRRRALELRGHARTQIAHVRGQGWIGQEGQGLGEVEGELADERLRGGPKLVHDAEHGAQALPLIGGGRCTIFEILKACGERREPSPGQSRLADARERGRRLGARAARRHQAPAQPLHVVDLREKAPGAELARVLLMRPGQRRGLRPGFLGSLHALTQIVQALVYQISEPRKVFGTPIGVVQHAFDPFDRLQRLGGVRAGTRGLQLDAAGRRVRGE
jgi:hypothetical protein